MRNDPIAVGNRRLLKLADLLDALPDERFVFKHWVDPETYEGKPDLSCGTTACAFGWATTVPAFRKLGLRLQRPGADMSPAPCMLGDNGEVVRKKYPLGGVWYEDAADRAAEAIFHIGPLGTAKLFLPDYYGDYDGLPGTATRKEVAANIRAFVNSAERLNGRV